MTPERWKKLASLYRVAHDCEQSERSEFLAQACAGDEELRSRLEHMLAQESGGQTLDSTVTAQLDGDGVALGNQLGPYRLERMLGSGGMGEVYRARDSRLERDVAIKVIRSERREEEHLQHRLSREARAISALNHPHICNVYDINEQDGLVYLVMEYIEGRTLAAVLKDGLLPLDRALRYGMEIADAAAAAHAKGIVHRDLKPGNVMITASGVKVLDFGLAKRVAHAAEYASAAVDNDEATRTAALTEAGQIIGTRAYMAPEQAEGKPADTRSDVFSLGIVLYEMFSGVRPFTGDTPLATLAAVIREIPKPLREIRPQVPVRIEQVVSRCLEKVPEKRYASAAGVYRDLAQIQAARTRPAGWRPALIGAAVVILIAAGALASRSYLQSSRSQWAEHEALPRLEELLSQHRLLAALPLSRDASQYLPGSRALAAVSEVLMVEHERIETIPPGAEVFLTDYAATNEADWMSFGPSPVQSDRIPYNGFYRLRATKAGFETVEATYSPVFRKLSGTTPSFLLHAVKETPAGMVWVPPAKAGTYGRPPLQKDVAGFWLDKYEVTNRHFKQFVDAGGYRNEDFWTEPFVQNGRTISWEQAMVLFTDATGKPGPATWQLGSYPEGEADHPVSGVSWYEAAAYAQFAGKSLPTVYHWYRAAGGGGLFSDILAFSNFGGHGAASVEANAGLSPFGSYDMAGNVKEWAQNAAGERRYILGGGWDEERIKFSYPDARAPLDRHRTFGFRCAVYEAPPEEDLLADFVFFSLPARNDPDVDTRTFQVYRDLHSYQKTSLQEKVDQTDDSSPYFSREDVSFRAAYGDKRVLAHLYLPKNVAPPFQPVVFFGSGDMFDARSIAQLHDPFEFIVRSGRALLIPAYQGTLERGPLPSQPREAMLNWSKDLGRSLDYLETRKDMDVTKTGYFGYSYGAWMAPRFLAVEPRIRTAVLVSGGSGGTLPAEVDPWNFVPYVQIPVLMLNGEDDFGYPLESSQRPLFRRLGTPKQDKRHLTYDGGHINLMFRMDVVKEVLEWFDRTLRPVSERR